LKLKPGMTANVTIETNRKANVLMVPSSALRFKPKDGKKSSKEKTTTTDSSSKKKKDTTTGDQVYILGTDGKPVAVPVTIGISADSKTEIVAGNLKENDTVITEQISGDKKKEEDLMMGGGGGPPGKGGGGGGPGF
jgi:HlyD family secretion protein